MNDRIYSNSLSIFCLNSTIILTSICGYKLFYYLIYRIQMIVPIIFYLKKTKLPKKIRSLGLKHALSSKVKNDELIVLDEAKLSSPKTKDFLSKVKKLKIENALFIDSDDFDKNFELAIKNVKGLELINIKGINVYDILRKEKLVLTKSSVEMLSERLQ